MIMKMMMIMMVIMPTLVMEIYCTYYSRVHSSYCIYQTITKTHTQRNIPFSGIFYDKIITCPENNFWIQFYAANTTLSPCLYNGSNKVHRTYSGETCTLYIFNAFAPSPNFGPQHNIYFLSSHKYRSCSVYNNCY